MESTTLNGKNLVKIAIGLAVTAGVVFVTAWAASTGWAKGKS